MLARLCFFSWAVLAPLALAAQPSVRNPAVAALNQYVEYCNETIHALWILHGAWHELNTSANSYRATGRGSLYFRADDVLNRADYYETLPAEIYQRCPTDSKVLGPAAQQALNPRLAAVKQTLDELQALGAEANRYVEQKQQTQDAELRRLYELLERAERAFDAYDVAKESLFTEVRRLYDTRYPPPNPRHRLVATAAALLPAIIVCKHLLDDLDRDDTSRVGAYLTELNGLIARYEADRTANLAGLYRFGANNGLDPGFRYDRVVNNLQAFAEHGRTFQSGRATQYGYEHRQKTEYFYNERFLNKYNRYGLGLIRDYNAFVELAQGRKIQRQAGILDHYIANKSIKLDVSVTTLLEWVEEPHQFKVIRPALPARDPAASRNAASASAPTAAPGATLEGYAANHLVFLLDVSGSMNRPEKLPLLQDAFRYLLTLTRRADRVAIVSYSGEAKVELKTVSAARRKKIEDRLDKLKTRGGTNANRGLHLAYEVAGQQMLPQGNNRIILATDGEFSISSATEALIAENRRRGIALSVFYFGPPGHVPITQQLQRLAELGNGNFRQITAETARPDLLREAQAVRTTPR